MRPIISWIGILIATLLAIGVLASASPSDSRIGISQGQKDQLKALAANTRDRTGRERDAMRRARMDLLLVYSSFNIDEHKAKAARESVSAAQMSLLNIHLDNEIALRNVLNSDQFQAFRDLMKRRMRNPEMLVLAPPEEDVLDRLPNKAMLDSLGVSADAQKQLLPSPEGFKAIQGLRRSSAQMLDLCSAYTLDSTAARKLIDNIHQDQMSLLAAQHHRQHTIRQILSEDQFGRLQQEITKRMAERERRHDRRR